MSDIHQELIRLQNAIFEAQNELIIQMAQTVHDETETALKSVADAISRSLRQRSPMSVFRKHIENGLVIGDDV